MKRPKTFVKWAVLASSVLLVVGLVSYRAGAFSRLWPGRDRAVMPSSKFSRIVFDEVSREPTEPEQMPDDGPFLLPGTKSDRIEIIPSNPPPAPRTDRTLMEGSKAPIFKMFPVRTEGKSPQPAPNPPVPPK